MEIKDIMNSKWFFRKALVVVTIIQLCIISLVDIPYTHKEDARKREYYPSIVVDKYSYKSCGKSSCRNYNEFTVELTNGEYKEVTVTDNVYNSYNIGDTVSFERNITDPEVISARRMQDLTIFVWIFVMLLLGLGGLLKDSEGN